MTYVTFAIALWALLRTIPRRYRWVPVPGKRIGMVNQEPIGRLEQARTARQRLEGKWIESLKRVV